MLGFLKNLFGNKKQDTAEQAPYKVEAPASAPTTDWPFPQAKAEAEVAPVVEAKPKKKPATKKATGEQKPAVKAKTARRTKKSTS